jgi:predicted DNA-binding transcriptional regulator AlpA
MSWHAHKTTSQRKIITVQEWADFTGVSKNTILAWMKKYKVAYPKVAYDPHDIYQWFRQKSGGDSAVSSEFVIAGMIFHHSRVKSELLHK